MGHLTFPSDPHSFRNNSILCNRETCSSEILLNSVSNTAPPFLKQSYQKIIERRVEKLIKITITREPKPPGYMSPYPNVVYETEKKYINSDKLRLLKEDAVSEKEETLNCN